MGSRDVWGPLTGRVVDAETKQPIRGAVVLAVWYYGEWWNPVHARTPFYDAREAVTDADGRFTIPSIRRPTLATVLEPSVRVFAPGYAFEREVVTPPTGRPLVDQTVWELRRVKTRKEGLREMDKAEGPSAVPLNKMCLLRRAYNQERRDLGFNPLPECMP